MFFERSGLGDFVSGNCLDGFVKDGDSGQCVDYDECEQLDATCGEGYGCQNQQGSYVCYCNKPGFTDNYGVCKDIDTFILMSIFSSVHTGGMIFRSLFAFVLHVCHVVNSKT